MEKLKEKLKRLREERGLSQVKLAARADLNPATVNQIERGMRDASPGSLRKLADALDVSLYELMEEEAPKAQAPPPPENGERGSKEETYFDADALGRDLAAQWRKALADAEVYESQAGVYGALLFRLFVAAGKARQSFEDAARGGYASRPEFRETLRVMDEAFSAIKAPTREFYNSLTEEMAERTAREFEELSEREGVTFDVPQDRRP